MRLPCAGSFQIWRLTFTASHARNWKISHTWSLVTSCSKILGDSLPIAACAGFYCHQTSSAVFGKALRSTSGCWQFSQGLWSCIPRKATFCYSRPFLIFFLTQMLHVDWVSQFWQTCFMCRITVCCWKWSTSDFLGETNNVVGKCKLSLALL